MSDDGKQPMQASGQNSPKLKPDGMTPGQRGRSVGGESGGGAYDDGGGKPEADSSETASEKA